MFWIKPKVADVRPGDSGVAVLLADRSSSMSSFALGKADDVLPDFRKAIPGLRVFVFHADFAEIPRDGNFYSRRLDRGDSKSGSGYKNCTYLGACMQTIAKLKPAKTIVLSDGGIADQERALSAADSMSGDIDAYFFTSTWQDKSFMEKLARRGRGRFVPVDPRTSDIRVELRRSLKVLLGPVIVRQHHAPEYIRDGGVAQQTFRMQPASSIADRFRKG